MTSYSIGYQAKLIITTKYEANLTYPDEVFFTAPFKLVSYFRRNNGAIEYIIMNASAGIMSGDNYLMEVSVNENTKLILTAQSFDKIHDMDGGRAQRTNNIKIANNGYLCYNQLPVIPFTGSSYSGVTNIWLENMSSKLISSEIIACGRVARNEKFNYKFYKSLINIYSAHELIYRDNCVLDPTSSNLSCFGMYENYSHMGMMIIFGFKITSCIKGNIELILANYSLDAGLTNLLNNGYLIRAFANNSEPMLKCFNQITNILALIRE